MITIVEIFNKYKKLFKSLPNGEGFDIIVDKIRYEVYKSLFIELSIYKLENDSLPEVLELFKIQNSKWNHIARKFKNKYKKTILKKDAFIDLLMEDFKKINCNFKVKTNKKNLSAIKSEK